MVAVRVETTQNVDLDYSIASVGDRLLGVVIDSIIRYVYLIVLIFLFARTNGFETVAGVTIFIILLLPFMLYSLICEVFLDGQTFGKMARDTKVIKLDGTQPNLGAYILRWVFRIIDNGIIGLIVILVSDKGQRLGDIVAGTTVIRKTRKTSLGDTLLQQSRQEYSPVFYKAANMTDEQAGLIREVLTAFYKDGNYMAAETLANKMKSLLGMESNMPPLDFLNTLLKDYAHFADDLSLLNNLQRS